MAEVHYDYQKTRRFSYEIISCSTWISKEYELNKTYADDKVAFSEYLKELREEVRQDTLKKLEEGEQE